MTNLMDTLGFPRPSQKPGKTSFSVFSRSIHKHGPVTQVRINGRKTIGIVFTRRKAFTTRHYTNRHGVIGRQEIIVSPTGAIRTVRTYPTQLFSLYSPSRWVHRWEWTASRAGLDKRVIAWQKAGYTLLYDCTGVYGDLPPWLAEPVEQQYLIHLGQVRKDKPVTLDNLDEWL